MTIPDDKLRELLEASRKATESPWHARGRFLSRVPDSTGMGGTLHTNHIANFADGDTCAYVAACDPTTIAGMVEELLRLRERNAQLEANLLDYWAAHGAVRHVEEPAVVRALRERAERAEAEVARLLG